MLYEDEKGKKILDTIYETIKQNGMHDMIRQGVVLGLSGGADSVMLLYALIELKKTYGDFDIKCVHVNHMIRGDEADADEKFCKELCKKLDTQLVTHRIDVPKIAKEMGQGLEEAARNIRYNVLEEEAKLLSKNACIAVAHNATDNLETIIFNMMRGTGITGLAGIKPVRGHIIRPLLSVSKEKIVDALNTSGIEYATDKTNFDSEYSRNYIRNDILPLLKKLNPDPEGAAARVSKNLRDDIAFIDAEADNFLNDNLLNDSVSVEKLSNLPRSVFSRVLAKIIRQKTNSMPEHVHIEKIRSLISTKDFEYSLPGKVRFISRSGYAKIESTDKPCEDISFNQKLSLGINTVSGFDNLIILSDSPIEESYSNVYKIEIRATLPSDIIKDGLYVRSKEDGDSYSYGGMTHKLKKLFRDKKIPLDKRSLIPLICDDKGIVWVPGFGVRNEEDGIKRSYIAITSHKHNDESKKSFFITKRK